MKRRRQVQSTFSSDGSVSTKTPAAEPSADADETKKKSAKMVDPRTIIEAPPTSPPRDEDKNSYWAAKESERADPPIAFDTVEEDLSSPKIPPDVRAVKIVTWNVAGFRSVLKKGFRDYVEREQPDILCLQETKIKEAMVPKKDLPDGYECVTFYECSDSPGRHGTALLSRETPIDVHLGLGDEMLDKEGRIITAEYETFYVICTYVPNSSEGLKHWAYRRRWDEAFLEYIKTLDAKKPVIWCGDLNVAHRWVDLCRPASNLNKTPGFLYGERDDFSKLLSCGFVDTYAHYYPGRRGMYTFWSWRGNARATNSGWRLDYFVVSRRVLDRVLAVFRRPTVMGSDHCPLGMVFSIAP